MIVSGDMNNSKQKEQEVVKKTNSFGRNMPENKIQHLPWYIKIIYFML